MHYLDKLDQLVKNGKITPKIGIILKEFYASYCSALNSIGKDPDSLNPILTAFLDMVEDQLKSPYHFEPFHKKITHPINYTQFGLDFIRPLILFETSKVIGLEYVDQMLNQIYNRENVILFANHQTEPDPQAIELLLKKTHPHFSDNLIFVAGHRVITDPLAVPFSKGCNLLCIYSKKYIETPREQKNEKLMHNKNTLKKMAELLKKGGACIYVAPSGGRDRPNLRGIVEISPFDPKSIELFYLLGKQSKRPTHFYPLALETHSLLPPPSCIEAEVGESRHAQCTPIHIGFGPEIEMEIFPGSCYSDKNINREKRAEYIWSLVKKDYDQFTYK